MHGAVAAGIHPGFREAARHMAGAASRCFTPQPAAHAVYERLYAEYLKLHDYFGRGGNQVLKRLKTLGRATA